MAAVADACQLPSAVFAAASTERRTPRDPPTSISHRDVTVPIPEAVKLKARAHFDHASCIPNGGLRPTLDPKALCKCGLLYDVAVLQSKATVYFPTSVARNVRVWAFDCPNANPDCHVPFDGSELCLWVCTKQVIVSEFINYECLFQVPVWTTVAHFRFFSIRIRKAPQWKGSATRRALLMICTVLGAFWEMTHSGHTSTTGPCSQSVRNVCVFRCQHVKSPKPIPKVCPCCGENPDVIQCDGSSFAICLQTCSWFQECSFPSRKTCTTACP